MFIIHGEYNSEKHRGVVAEHCENCDTLTVQRVMQHYRSQHLYFIPLGSHVVSTLVCIGCGAKIPCAMDRYATTLPELASRALPVGDILLRTNPQLAERVARVVNFEGRADDLAAQNSGGYDPRIQLTLKRFATLDGNDPRVAALEARLSRWNSFDAVGKADLLRDMEATVSRENRRRSGAKFVQRIAERLKAEPDALPQVFTFCFVLLAGPLLSVRFVFWSNAAVFASVVLSFAAALVAAGWVRRRVERWRLRRFFRKTLLPEAEAKAIDPSELIAALTEINVLDETIDIRLRRMAKAVAVLRHLIAERFPEQCQLEVG